MIKHRLSKVEAKIRPKKTPLPGRTLFHHTHNGDMTEAEFNAGLSAKDAADNAEFKARMKERKPEGMDRDFIINVVHLKKSGRAFEPDLEPTDAELESEIKRLESELAAKKEGK